MKRCNVLVIGNTGVGKSTLISNLFQVSISNSVTPTISDKPYTKPGLPIAVYDAPGLETDKKQRDKVKQDIADFINDKNQNETINKTINNFIKGKKQKETKEPENQIHAVWYCVDSHVVRESQVEQQWIASIAVNDKANSAFYRCLEGCTQVLTTQILPIPFPKSFAISGIQVWMLANISKAFGYKFDRTYLTELCTVGFGAFGSFIGFDSFIEEALKNLPGIDYNNIQTVKDVLSHLKTMLEHSAGTLPFKKQLIELLTGIADFNLVSGLPILSCLSAISTTIATGVLAIAYIETMKNYKKAEYEGQAMPELKEVFAKQMQQLMGFIRQLQGGGWSPGFVN